MGLRSVRERILLVLTYEICAFIFAIPLYSLVFGQSFSKAGLVLIVLTLAEMLVGFLHDWVFDLIEYRRYGRRADLRPAMQRLWHAISREVLLMVTSVPIIVALTGLSWMAAVLTDLGFAAAYLLFNLVFFRFYDWLRPVGSFDLAVHKPS